MTLTQHPATPELRPAPPPSHAHRTYLGRPSLWPASELRMTACGLKAEASPLSSSRLAAPHSQASPASPYLPRLTGDPCVKCKKPRTASAAAGFTAPFRLTVANAGSPGSSPGLVCDHLNEMRLWRTSHSFPGEQTEADAGVGQHLHQLLLQVHLTFSTLMSEINE